jgi:hypothetical protein
MAEVGRLAILCVMRDADWTFREAEVRWAEHHKWRTALGSDHVPAYTTLSRVLHRLYETVLEEILRSRPTADSPAEPAGHGGRRCNRPFPPDAMPAGTAAGHRIQHLSPVVVHVPWNPKAVNRARLLQEAITSAIRSLALPSQRGGMWL